MWKAQRHRKWFFWRNTTQYKENKTITAQSSILNDCSRLHNPCATHIVDHAIKIQLRPLQFLLVCSKTYLYKQALRKIKLLLKRQYVRRYWLVRLVERSWGICSSGHISDSHSSGFRREGNPEGIASGGLQRETAPVLSCLVVSKWFSCVQALFSCVHYFLVAKGRAGRAAFFAFLSLLSSCLLQVTGQEECLILDWNERPCPAGLICSLDVSTQHDALQWFAIWPQETTWSKFDFARPDIHGWNAHLRAFKGHPERVLEFDTKKLVAHQENLFPKHQDMFFWPFVHAPPLNNFV